MQRFLKLLAETRQKNLFKSFCDFELNWYLKQRFDVSQYIKEYEQLVNRMETAYQENSVLNYTLNFRDVEEDRNFVLEKYLN